MFEVILLCIFLLPIAFGAATSGLMFVDRNKIDIPIVNEKIPCKGVGLVKAKKDKKKEENVVEKEKTEESFVPNL